MAAAKKVRVYDLAKDLKQDAKRVIEDLRREGADVSVPSNSVSVEIAEKVRLKYFPKTEIAPKRAIKVIKKKADSEVSDDIHETAPPAEVSEISHNIPEIAESQDVVEPESSTPSVRKVLKKKPVEVVEIDQPVEETVVEEADVEVEVELPEEAPEAEVNVDHPESRTVTKVLAKKVVKPVGTQIKTLTLTKESLQKGIKPGERVVSEAPTKAGKLATDIIAARNQGRPGQFRGTPGETASP
ncbi:MAG: translation initiation factor IF-2 N-terminal domain-containing protein, partial [Pyrinomonadaceae bacterium]